MATTTTVHGLRTSLMIGMEVHVELSTRTKMWTGAPNLAHPDRYDAEPNSLLDPVVIGMPGTLPVMNRQAVAMSIKVGLALGCSVNRWSKWDRKSYYYPDLPKNYQISQYDLPLCGPGVLECPVSDEEGAELRPIRIRRAHLEEDAGKLLHEAPGGRPIDYSIVDLNRAGTPLLEIVTEPDITSADQAVAFAQALRNICRFLGVTEGVMQQGQIRFEPNINVIIERPDGSKVATPIAEIKNLNSFRSLRGAIEHEHQRQVEQYLDDGVTFAMGNKATRGWDDVNLCTFVQREKEEAHDYRYFPDPDLVPVTVSDAWLEEIRATVGELPMSRKRRYVEQLGLSAKDAAAIVEEREVCAFFEAIVAAGVEGRRAAAIVRNNLARLGNERGRRPSDLGVTAAQVAAIQKMLDASAISSNGADQLFALCADAGDGEADPAALAERHGLLQVSDDSALDAWVDAAIAAEPAAANDLRAGNMKAAGRLVGAVMKLSGGKANPKAVQDKIRQKLAGA